MWFLTWTLACGPDPELERSKAELARLTQENSAQQERIAALESEIATMRPAYNAAKSLEEAAEREFSAPSERCVGQDGAFTFAGDLAALARVELWARAARLLPAPDSAGFRVLAIRRDSLLSSCGFRNGDIVESINGVTLAGMDSWPELTKNSVDELRFALNRAGAKTEVVIRAP